MEFIKIGEIVNTHGIKGEVRLISEFKYKDLVFKKGITLYIGRFKDKVVINSYRKHKIYDMLTFDGINNINDVLVYKSEFVYIDRDTLGSDVLLNEDLIGYQVLINNKEIGKIVNIVNNRAHDILVVEHDEHKHMIPYVDEFIESIDKKERCIIIKEIEGLINEN